MTPLDLVLSKLLDARRNGSGWTARCPAHDDREPSLRGGRGDDGRVLLKCFAGCEAEQVVAALGLTMADLFERRNGAGWRGEHTPPKTDATAQPPPGAGFHDDGNRSASAQASGSGCTLARYAADKRLPLDFLRELGLSDFQYFGTPAVRIPYSDTDGNETAIRFRLAFAKGDGEDQRFKWRKGDKVSLYGLWRLRSAIQAGWAVLVEGESDAQTLWLHGYPALAVPGASNWNEDRDAGHFDRIPTVYLSREPDRGGDTLLDRIGKSRIRDTVRVVSFGACKDPSGLHLDDPERFKERFQAALDDAVPWVTIAAAQGGTRRREALERCRELARRPRILDDLAEQLPRAGLVGERRSAQILYLMATSRLLARIASGVVKGPSSAGKSHLVQTVLGFFPPSAYYALSAMSERALAYSDEPLRHRMLVIYEAAGLGSDFASYLVRSLLSEGRIRYETVEKTGAGLKPKLIEREGPTGLIVTTTAVKLHAENETRLLTLLATDSSEQTQAVLSRLAQEEGMAEADYALWHALQVWLEGGNNAVSIPWAGTLAEMIPPVAVRLRRDFGMLLTLIRAHALLHQASRETDASDRIVASLDDYEVVRELVADLVSQGVEATVPPTVRETVEAVREIIATGTNEVMVAAIARHLRIDKATAWRRAASATEAGYLRNLEDKRGRPARLVLGEPMPEDLAILPTVAQLAERAQAAAGGLQDDGNPPPGEGCTVAGVSEGEVPPLPPAPCACNGPPTAVTCAAPARIGWTTGWRDRRRDEPRRLVALPLVCLQVRTRPGPRRRAPPAGAGRVGGRAGRRPRAVPGVRAWLPSVPTISPVDPRRGPHQGPTARPLSTSVPNRAKLESGRGRPTAAYAPHPPREGPRTR